MQEFSFRIHTVKWSSQTMISLSPSHHCIPILVEEEWKYGIMREPTIVAGMIALLTPK